MSTIAIVITVVMVVLVLLAVGYSEIKNRNRRRDEPSNVSAGADPRGQNKTMGPNDMNPGRS